MLTPYRLMFVEEPARAEFIGSTARLRQEFRVALATGENLYGVARFAELLDADAVDIIQPDLLCCGGLLEAKKIAAIAEAHYVTVAPHNPLGLLSTATAVHLAASIPNFTILEWGFRPQAKEGRIRRRGLEPGRRIFRTAHKARHRNGTGPRCHLEEPAPALGPRFPGPR